MANVDDLVQQLRTLSPEDRAIALYTIRSPPVPRSDPSYFIRKLRIFSGKSPVPAGEVEFETWRTQAKQLEDDDDVSPAQKKRIILQSLFRPAMDAVKSVVGDYKEILTILDTLYGSVVDGQDLLIQFHTTYQHEKENNSDYLQRLYLLAMDVADKGGYDGW